MRRIVCGYELEALPTWWLMVHREVRAGVERRGWQIKVDLTPLTALPPDVDVLLVAPELMVAATERAPHADCMAIGAARHADAVVELLSHLADAARYRVAPRSGAETQGVVVQYQGYGRVD